MLKVSIIIPVYNAEKKIEKAISSVLNQTMNLEFIEAIFVDDCSTDRSVDIIQRYCDHYSNFRLIQLEENSGSPSRPRNYGVRASNAEYIMFLDADDVLLENSCHLLYSEAKKRDFDIVRGYLKVFKDGNDPIYVNRLRKEEYTNVTNRDLIKNLIARQSTTIDGIYKKECLIANNIYFSEDIRMGEDTLYISKCYAKANHIQYIDESTYGYVKRDEINNASSTQSYGSRELNDHLAVWKEAKRMLGEIGVDYYKLRLHVGFRSALESMLNYSNGEIPFKDFENLKNFLLKNKSIIPSMNLNPRLKSIVESILDGNYDAFVQNTRKRILINGYDLKFIKPLIPYLEQKYEVKIDEWQGHEKHDEKKSRELLEWADVIFCEWLLGNAVWYSKNKISHQLLFVRMHRFEMFQNYGDRTNFDNVDCFIAVGMYYYEEFIRSFNLPREKVRLIPNHVDFNRFNKPKNPDSSYNLGIIGGLPARKRIDLAIDVLEKLLEFDLHFKLHIIGSKPEDVPWLWKIETEREFYEEVYKRINDNPSLKNAVIFTGWEDSAEYLRNIGFVLSVSDSDKPESFHLAPAEGMASGAVGLLLQWPGVEYIYPDEFIVGSIEEMANKIYELMNRDLNEIVRNKSKRFISESYNITNIGAQFDMLIQRGFLRRN